jgi:hypothetical protein
VIAFVFYSTFPANIAEAAIINFPKRHGNIIQEAVGVALRSYPGD